MTDVEAGGATVFPEIGLRLVPEKVCVTVMLTFELSVCSTQPPHSVGW